MPKTLQRWDIRKSAELYGITDWSSGFFEISDSGEVVLCPQGRDSEVRVSLMDIVDGLKERGLNLPVLLRCNDILAARVNAIAASFKRAMKEGGYGGDYRGVYPIKVNQQWHVVEEILSVGASNHHGLEVGSKGELLAAIGCLDDPEALLICNGYKDEEFMELALYARKMGMNVIVVAEMPGEVPLILECARRLGVMPRLGVRVKLSSRAGGHWTDSGGDRSRFGLTSSQLVDVVEFLRENDALDCLVMLHYHLGSQIPNIRDIRTGIREACRFYAGLVAEGAPMGVLDVGGGLAVDYDGSHTNFPSSSNYGLDEYCADIVEGVIQVLDAAGVPHPLVVSEAGRATVAHHEVLLFNVLDSSRFESHDIPETLPEDCSDALGSIKEVLDNISAKTAHEGFHDATYYRDELRSLFVHGNVGLRERALAEQIFWRILTRIAKFSQDMKYVPEELQGLEATLSDVYYGNFSLFQSLPDSWAIEQLFPIMPIHRLGERPTRFATIADITCDCDGKIDRFIDLHDVRHALPLHELREGEDYCLAVFLVGAYQETLGDLHNLMGDTNVASMTMGEDGQVEFDHEIAGDSVSDVLSYVEYEPKELVNAVRAKAERSVRRGELSPSERRAIMDAYENGLRGYTYYER
jgi:arginine decarboxylase